ncbi:MAG: hypothetical protein MUE40_19535 [Anaerolineae bacterium]|jgi:hypothetical protein|nr:hypothetical protein [Anaerolineae bacterium]
MSALNLKRLVVVLLSQLTGVLLTVLLIGPGFELLRVLTGVATIHGVTPEEYGTIYFLVTSVPIGLIIMIWMDGLMDTRILPD